jgi:hypothetical protein
MADCFNCGKKGEAGQNLKQEFYIEIGESKGSKLFRKEILIKGEFWRDVNIRFTRSGLCKECMALALEESARVVRRMDDANFKFA